MTSDASQYTFKEFRRSTSAHKKYDAVLVNKKTKREKKVPFGDSRYEQFKDKALGLYKHKDHNDPKRRTAYRQRHAGEEKKKFSPGYFAWKFLW